MFTQETYFERPLKKFGFLMNRFPELHLFRRLRTENSTGFFSFSTLARPSQSSGIKPAAGRQKTIRCGQ